MLVLPQETTRTDTIFPDTTLVRSQAPRLRAAQGVAFGGGGEDVVVVPDGRVVHVAVVGGDVEVAQHHQPRVRRDLGREPVVHGVEPAQLVGVFLVAHVLAVATAQD